MSTWYKYVIASIALVIAQSSGAQEVESAPQEAPFIQEENEFDSFLTEEPVEEAPSSEAPPQSQSVDLNKQVPEEAVEELVVEEEEKAIVEEPTEAPVDNIVRRSTKGGVEYIAHPQASKGLLAITKEGAYIYKTTESRDFHQTGTFRVATMDSPNIVAADGTTYETMYSGSQQPFFMFDYEWQPFTGFGKLGVQAGFGLLYATGQGRFVSTDPAVNGTEAKESYTFLAIPLNLGVVYRLEWLSRQWVAPYVSGGGTYVAVAEFRDDGKSPTAVGTPGAYGAAGLLLNVSAADRETAFTLSSEYGIANLWVSLEYRYLQTVSEDLDFSSNIIGAGISVDY